MNQPETTTTCPECSGQIYREKEETLCGTCGLVVAEDHLDRGPEWRAFNRTKERTGAPLTRARHDRGLSTKIGFASRRASGAKRRRFARLRRQHNRALIATKQDRNKVYAFTEIRRIISALSLPTQTRDHACILFEQAQKADLLRGRSVEGFAAAAVYAACRVETISRTLTEIAEISKASHDELKTAYVAMNRELGLPTGPIDPREYLPRFASELGLPSRIEKRAVEHVTTLTESGDIGGRNPSGVAAACLYTAATEENHPLTQKDAADVANVTPVTLRATHHLLTGKTN